MKTKKPKKLMRKSYLEMRDMISAGLALVGAAVALGVGATVVDDMNNSLTNSANGGVCSSATTANCTVAYNATIDNLEALTTLSSYFPLIGTALAGAIVIGVVLRYLGNNMMN